MSKYENMCMIKVALFSIFADIVWRLAFSRGLGNKNKATNLWIKAQVLKANFCANHVWFGSEWHGLNCEVDFEKFKRKAVISVELKEVVK